jgi:DNA invertase Pin-like site-specific DNA recombinase
MTTDSPSKVQARHLKRRAYLYVRQSSLKQVLHHTESTERQYALQRRAVALGWPSDRIVVIDADLGQSGASAADRHGFQELVAEVGMGHAGIVMGLEVSRLARNNADWHRLLEICALTDTLILDEDGVYDPAHFNDRLLLGLKGTMSEAELHLLHSRLIGGMLNKARRGELRSALPIGLVYDAADRVVLDPDQQVQQTLRLFFETFERTGSASATVKHFRVQQLHFPQRVHRGPRKGELIWGDLLHSRARWLLHNPRYAGAFCYGRTRQKRRGERHYERVPREEWTALVRDAHPGYISWEKFEQNQERLRENAAAHGAERRHGPPREGPALLQGLVICARCGTRMTVRYSTRRGTLHPEYVCQRERIDRADPSCQHIAGASIDAAVGQLVVESLSPLALEMTLAVQQELETRLEEADALRRQAVERARYEAELARRRYLRVDPDNRLVADALEADWNDRLRALTEAEEHYRRERESDRAAIDEEKRTRIVALASDFPALWHNPATPDRERKRMLRLLLEDVTLLKGEELIVHVRFRGGATKTLTLPRPLPAWKIRQSSEELIAQIDRLLDDHTDKEIADLLNAKGFRSGEGKTLDRLKIHQLRHGYGLKSRSQRLREAGYLTREEMAEQLGLHPSTVSAWRRHGWLASVAYNDRGEHLFPPPGPDVPVKHKRKSRAKGKLVTHSTEGAKYEA